MAKKVKGNRAGYIGMHRDEGEWTSRNFTLYYNEESQKHSRKIRVEEVQSYSEENDCT